MGEEILFFFVKTFLSGGLLSGALVLGVMSRGLMPVSRHPSWRLVAWIGLSCEAADDDGHLYLTQDRLKAQYNVFEFCLWAMIN